MAVSQGSQRTVCCTGSVILLCCSLCVLLVGREQLKSLTIESSNNMIGAIAQKLPLAVPPMDDEPQPCCALASEESFGFFDDLTDSEWRRRQDVARGRVDHLGSFEMQKRSPKLFYLNNYYPSFSCPEIRRVAPIPGDGPKFVCDPHRLPSMVEKRMNGKNDTRNGCLVYSVGSAGKFEFEDGLVDLFGPICEIHIFDPKDYSAPGMDAKNMHFHSWGIKGSQGPASRNVPGEFLSVQDTVGKLGHEDRIIDILKIDCEGCEWSSFNDWLKFDIRQVLVEVHNVPSNAIDFFDGLAKAGYVIFSKEANIHPGASSNNNLCVEYSFLKLQQKFSNKTLQ